jgi:hypothetical protein
MAKKTVASLQKGSKDFTKVIKAVKNEKTGAYSYEESILPNDLVKEYIERK